MTRRIPKRALVWLCVAAIAIAALALYACAPKQNPGIPTPKAEAPSYVPEANSFGVIEAHSWADQYPNQYSTFLSNDENTWPEGKASKDELYPEMVTLGKGYGYAKFFMEPGGHTYALYTVMNNGRVSDKTKAQCLACKTPNLHFEAAEMGNEAWQRNMFATAETYKEGGSSLADAEGISCANCHVNDDPTQLKPLRADWIRAMGPDADKRSVSGEVCGQCHCDYSMDAVTGEPTSPYDSISEMTPDNAIEWYDNHNFVDWTYESTGAKMLAVRHSEYEYNYGGEGNHMTKLGYDCADCHMKVETDADGNAYTSHYWGSPLDNDELIKNDCSNCHKDLKAEVKQTQEEVWGRTHQVGQRTACYVQNFEKALAAGTVADSDLERLQYIQRAAAYYWNSAFAENSKGAHNRDRFMHVLDQAEKLLDEGDQLLGMESSAEGFVSEYDPANDKAKTLDFPESLPQTQDYGLPEAEKYGYGN